MALSKAVQFRGIKDAVNAYENRGIPAWGLFCGTQFLDKYEGDEIEEGKQRLKKFLDSMDPRSADTNTYTLVVYEDSTGKINSATKFDGSFNFRLVDNFDDYRENRGGGVNEKIAGLEKKIAELTADDDLEPELTMKDRVFAALGTILEHPHVQQALAMRLSGIIDGVGNMVSGVFQPFTPPQSANTRSAIGTVATAQDENQKLQQAVNILSQVDPLLGTHLLQLAMVAQSDPEKYKSLIGMLKLL